LVAASRPFADWYFGEPDVAADIVEEWMRRPSSELYAGRAILAEDEQGEVVGCVLALRADELAKCRAADFSAFCAELGGAPEADEVIAEVVAVSHELFPPVDPHDVYVSRVGVDPRRRGQGIGRALVEHAITAHAGQGLDSCRLDVSADNSAAIRAYEAAGLQIVATSHSATAGLTYHAMRTKL
jgi:ribosomal protein S18 acetylase RimI-like enzyme